MDPTALGGPLKGGTVAALDAVHRGSVKLNWPTAEEVLTAELEILEGHQDAARRFRIARLANVAIHCNTQVR